MTDDLDLSVLTDDQLVALARLVIAEAGQRRMAVQEATKAAFVQESEKLHIASLATEAERAVIRADERKRVEALARADARLQANANAVGVALAARPENPQEASWQRRKMLALMVRQSLGDGWTLTVWRTQDGKDRRVYLDKGNETNRYGAKLHPHAAYYDTGTADGKHAPRTMSVGKIPVSLKLELIEVAKVALALFNSGNIECDTAAGADVGDLPIPKEYADANATRLAREATK